MYGYGYKYTSGLVVGSGGAPTPPPFVNTKSLLFDGVNDYVDCGSASYLNGLTEFSVSAWFNLTTAADNKCILADWNYNSSPFGHFTIQTTNTLGGEFRLMFFIKAASDVGNNYIKTSARICTEATWYNITATYNAGVCKMYINGVEAVVGLFGTIPTALTTQDGNLNIGRFPGIGRNWNGNIDEVAIYNYALSDTDALAIGGTVPTDLSLLATPPTNWYRMGDLVTAFPTIPDVIGTNDGTAFNENEATMVVPDVP